MNVRGTNSLGASTLNVSVGAAFTLLEGQKFTILNNDLTDAISGTLASAAEGAVVSAGPYKFRISYVGGSGNDVTLTFTNPPLKGISAFVSGGNGNGIVGPNECNHFNLIITNTSGASIRNISATLPASSFA